MIRDFTPVRWRTRSPRRLVGGRTNKRITLIGTMRSDRRAATARGSKPNHAARAVSLDACFPGTTGVFVGAAMGGRTKVRQVAAVAGSYGRSAATMTMQARLDRYVTQRVTPAQLRRLKHKARRSGELV